MNKLTYHLSIYSENLYFHFWESNSFGSRLPNNNILIKITYKLMFTCSFVIHFGNRKNCQKQYLFMDIWYSLVSGFFFRWRLIYTTLVCNKEQFIRAHNNIHLLAIILLYFSLVRLHANFFTEEMFIRRSTVTITSHDKILVRRWAVVYGMVTSNYRLTFFERLDNGVVSYGSLWYHFTTFLSKTLTVWGATFLLLYIFHSVIKTQKKHYVIAQLFSWIDLYLYT
jgi:hypothetical protein